MLVFRNRGARAGVSMQFRPNHPNYSQLGCRRFRVHPPNPPQVGHSCSLLPFEVLHNVTAFPSKARLKWIGVGLWSLAACAGRSTRSKGLQQTIRPSLPGRVRSFRSPHKPHKERGRKAGRQEVTAVLLYRQGFTLPQRSDETLGRGPRLCKWSAALSAV